MKEFLKYAGAFLLFVTFFIFIFGTYWYISDQNKRDISNHDLQQIETPLKANNTYTLKQYQYIIEPEDDNIIIFDYQHKLVGEIPFDTTTAIGHLFYKDNE